MIKKATNLSEIHNAFKPFPNIIDIHSELGNKDKAAHYWKIYNDLEAKLKKE
jgi:hypothetical protein